MPPRSTWLPLALLPVALLLTALPVRAADPKYEFKGVEGAKPADVVKPTVWQANVSAGLVWVSGGAESLGLSGTALASVKRWNNEVTFNSTGAYVSSGVSYYGKGGPITGNDRSAENWLAKLRYDRYFLTSNTVFASFQGSGDRPAGFSYRLEPQVGYARILFFKSEHQVVRAELGYAYTREHRVPQPTPDLPRDVDYHSARLFLFYENKLTPTAAFSEGLELLEAVNRLEGFRLNSVTSLSSQLYKNLALKLNFKLQFNNDPAARPAPTNIDPATMMPFVLPADQARFGKLNTQMDVVLAVTFL